MENLFCKTVKAHTVQYFRTYVKLIIHARSKLDFTEIKIITFQVKTEQSNPFLYPACTIVLL
jgi:hypothetical protein